MNQQTEDFTHRLAKAQDELIDAAELQERVRDRVLSGARPRVDRSATRWWIAGGAAISGCAAAAAALIIVTAGPSDMTATHGEADLEVGSWIAATDDPAQIDFSDGTIVRLDPGSTARLAAMDERGAHLMLERGTVDLDVVHTGDADWQVQAGPYTIEVTGTAFQTTWTPELGDFTIDMREGSVIVTGPDLGSGQPLGVGSWKPPRAEVVLNEPVQVQGQADEPEQPEVAPPTGPAPKPAGEAEEVQDWFETYQARDYAGAIQLATELGIDSVLSDSSSKRLLGLADAANRAGDQTLQTRSLETVRARFTGTSEAASAAFELGRVAQDKNADAAGAAQWFRKAHDEGNGPLALGKHMLALEQAGDAKAAKQAATEYLEKYPAGSHADSAKGLAKRKR